MPPGAVAIPVGDSFALVEEADAELVLAHHWRPMVVESGAVYAWTIIDGRQVYMHRLVAQTPAGLETDHRNRNTLDNRSGNLRIATTSQNQANRVKFQYRGRPASSIYKGVTWYKASSLWQASIKVNRRPRYLGRYESEVDAARAYDRAAFEAWGEFAHLNLPDEVAA